MSTEEYNKRGFPIGNFLLKLILVIVFVFLLCWLLPKFMVPAITKLLNGKGCNATCECIGIKALTSQIFADNLDKMKEAAISYYTNERLPQEVGKSKKMTLSDMIGLKIIVPLIDKNGKAVDVEKSYVQITKADDEYILKVNIKDSEKEDYILVHIGCYNYCESYVCEKKTTNVPIKSGKETTPTPTPTPTPVVITCVKYNGQYYDNAGKVVSYEEYKKACVPEVAHSCVKYDGKYYNAEGKEVSYEEFKKSCLPAEDEKHYCVKYNNKYYDMSGNVVSYEEYKKACVPEDIHSCVKYNGKYYNAEGKEVTFEEFKKSCLPAELHICVKYNDKYYDNNGNEVSYEDYQKACGDKKDYLYEYKKSTESKFSAWSLWSAWEKTDCITEEINCNDNEPTCLLKLQRYDRKEQIGTYEKSYAQTREILRQTGSYQEKSCSKYNYVIINSTIYATTTTTKYTQTNVITSSTKAGSNGWTYVGRQLFTNPPRDTETVHYKFAGADYSYCSDTCTTLPKYYYDVYKYTGGLNKVTKTTVTPETTTTTTVTHETSTDASCGEYVYKTIPIYSTITVTEKAYRTEPLYGTVCYKSTKTRELLSQGKTSYKWSTYNDTTLLNNGWSYTGNRKEK